MTKSATAKRAAKSSPDTFARTGRKVGVELTETQLGQIAGGLVGTGKTTKIHF